MLKRIALAGALSAALVTAALAYTAPTPPNTSGTTMNSLYEAMAAAVDRLDTLIAGAPTTASEAHIGEVGNNQVTVTVAQTVTAASAYASGNAVGGLITFAAAARVAAGSGLIQSIVVNSKSLQSTQMDLVVFSANPTGSTCTDKNAVAVAAADFDKVLGVAHITDWTALGTPSAGQAQNLAMPFALSAGTTLYGCLVTRSTPTFTATTDISVSLRVIRN